MATLITASDIGHLCYTKSTWAASWVERSLLVCRTLSDAVAPSHSTATLFQLYGRQQWTSAIGTRPKDTAETTVPKPNYLGHYVKVVTTNGLTWYGVIVETDDAQDGTLDGVPTGRVSMTAMGLSFLLERAEPINRSKFKTASGTDFIEQAIPFNAGSDGRLGRSRLATGNYDSTSKCFTDKTVTSGAQRWKAKDAFDYLGREFAPKDYTGSKRIPLFLSAASAACLDYEIPRIDYAGQNLWQVFNQLVDRRRGLVMYTLINGANQLELVVDSSSTSQISLPSGSIVPANRNKRTYTFDGAVNIDDSRVRTSAIQQYDQVLCRGENVGAVFTVAPTASTGQIIPDWGTSESDDYNAACSGDTNYGSLTDTEKAASNADYRARDDLSRVFSWWRLDTTWDGKGHNDGATNQPAAFAFYEDTGEPRETIVGSYWIDGLRFADYMPLRPGVDYSGAVTADTDSSDDEQRDYLAPAVFFQLEAIGTTTGDDGWVYAEHVNRAVDSGDTKREYQWSVQVIIRDDVPGLILQVVGGQQHFIAQDEYTANGTYENIPSNEGVNLRSFLATVYMPLQWPVTARYPANNVVTSGDVKRVLTLNVPDCWLDWLVPGTVVSVSSGELQQTDGGWLRDDRDRLRDIAKLAYSWYSQPRRSLALSFRAITSGFAVGQLVTSITQAGSTQQINTVITSIELDLEQGRTTLNTSFAELDFVGLSS